MTIALLLGSILLGVSGPAPVPNPTDDCPQRSRASALVIVPADPDITVVEGALEVGDVITALTPTGECAGSAVWTGEGAVISVWEDDPFTPLLDGMLQGDPITFVAYDLSAGSPATTASVNMVPVHGGVDGFGSEDLYVVRTRATSAPSGPEADDALTVGPSFPNPLQTTTTIPLTVGATSRVALDVFDALGRHVLQPLDRDLSQGTHHVDVDASGLAPGLYFYRATAGQRAAQGTFTVSR